MSNGVRFFVNMKNCIFLIILLDFIRITLSSQIQNSTEEDVCPVAWYRRKRATGDYTRWRWNIETTPEFIVKVLDEEMTQVTANKLVGVNILPQTKRNEKIIVGGALVLSTTTATALPRDYTRFMPPTVSVTAKGHPDPKIVSIHEAIPPNRKDTLLPVKNSVLNAFRDESPPAGPQFLPRTRMRTAHDMATRQYAPIAPVAFTRHTTGTPLTPPSYETDYTKPIRSPSTLGPTRTGIIDKLDDFHILQALIDHEVENHITRTSLHDGITRTRIMETGITTINYEDIPGQPTTLRHADIEFGETDEAGFGQIKDTTDRDASYNNMLFQNTENKESIQRKDLDIINRNEYDDKQDNELNKASKPSDAELSNSIAIEESDSVLSVVKNKTVDTLYPEVSVDITSDNQLTGTGENMSSSILPEDKKRPVCNLIKLRPLNFNAPRTLPEIEDQLRKWTEESPVAKWADITGGNLTTMENPIYIVIVDDPSVGQVASEKQNVLLVAGISGRDHHAVNSAMYVLYQLIERSDTHQDLLSKFRFWIIPVFNPDGYDYSMTFPHKRGWVKNLRQSWEPCLRESCPLCISYGIRCTINPCYGVNLDRNFEYQWIPTSEVKAEHQCGNLYAGPRQISEVESQALKQFIYQQHMTISVFIAFKEGDVLGVMYPYSHTKKRRAFDQFYRQLALQAAASAFSIAGRKFVAGQTSEFLPLYAGGIEDWADGHLGIDSTYTIIMFRPIDTPNSKYLGERVIHESYAAMDSLLLSVGPHAGRSQVLTLTRAEAPTAHRNALAITLTSLASFLLASKVLT